jgi:hypothetical protein
MPALRMSPQSGRRLRAGVALAVGALPTPAVSDLDLSRAHLVASNTEADVEMRLKAS